MNQILNTHMSRINQLRTIFNTQYNNMKFIIEEV